MKAVFLNPFLNSLVQIMQSVIDETPQRGKVFIRDKYPYTTSDVAIIVGITGVLSGQVVLSMTRACAKGVAAKMLMEDSVSELDEYAQSALGEMANMLIANATIALADAGYMCDITTPSVITGSGMEVSCHESIPTVVIPMTLSLGNVDVNLSMTETAMLSHKK